MALSKMPDIGCLISDIGSRNLHFDLYSFDFIFCLQPKKDSFAGAFNENSNPGLFRHHKLPVKAFSA